MEAYWFLSQYAYNNSHKIGRDLLKGVFEQTEKRLTETVQTGNEISARAYGIFAFSLPLLILSMTYFMIQKLHHQAEGFTELASLFSSVVFLFTCGLSLAAILPRAFYRTGSEPRYTLNRIVVEAENQLVAFLLSECNHYQFRIDHNKKVNATRMLYVHIAMCLLLLIPGLLVVAWIVH